MSENKQGGLAFPHVRRNEYDCAERGMTLRDYFAAKAMAGMLAYPGCESRGSHHNNNTPDGVATMAYKYADAMLRARGEA
ncbi:TPA: hypothetical protein QDB05_000235 [Burkholderia vietnamiensis]|nr:hypothetical protein [Burkholderia vietnamiensis]